MRNTPKTPPEAQQGQVGVRAEPPVPQADVAGLKRGMQLHDLGHVVGPERGGQDLAQQARAGVKEDQQVGHWETAARTLVAWLTEVPLQLGGIGHGATRAVHDEGSVATPAALLVDPLPAGMGQERFGQAAEQAFEDPQGKSPSRLAEGRTGEGFVTLAG